jgi:single-strand selective monofunctional uracil DNA glycosylase
MEQSARNRTPDKLPANEREPLTAVCDNHLLAVLQLLKPTFLVAVGVYAEACFKRVVQLGNFDATIVRILHPSPASPAANNDWAGQVTKQLVNAGLWKS